MLADDQVVGVVHAVPAVQGHGGLPAYDRKSA
jgi:hypothetical protein